MQKFFLLLLLAGMFSSVARGNEPFNQILHRAWTTNQFVRCTDAAFLRRLSLVALGRSPTAEEAKRFLANQEASKREKRVDEILDSPECIDLLTMRFADLLRMKSEFPINLWPNAVQMWHRKIHDELAADRPYSDMVRDFLTTSGSNFKRPHANFFRACAERSPSGWAQMVAQTLLGMRLSDFPREVQSDFPLFFSRIRMKRTEEWKEEIVFTDPLPVSFTAKTPDGKTFSISAPNSDPRALFADWLLDAENPFFARAAVNRVWSWIFGTGLTGSPDTLPLPSTKSGALAAVERDLIDLFRRSGYRLKPLYRAILTSDAFQAQIAREERDAALFAAYPIRRLEAELIVDELARVTGEYDRYSSVIPEPFTFLPAQTRSITIADGSLTSAALECFGRPPRDHGTAAERNQASTESQRLYLMNSGTLYNRLQRMVGWSILPNPSSSARMDQLYLLLLARLPSKEERKIVEQFLRENGKNNRRAWSDLAWMLVNSREFLFYP